MKFVELLAESTRKQRVDVVLDCCLSFVKIQKQGKWFSTFLYVLLFIHRFEEWYVVKHLVQWPDTF